MKLKTVEVPGWDLIKELGWGTKTTDCNKIQAYLFSTYDSRTVANLRSFVLSKQSELIRTIEKWEDNNRELNIGSDDGFSDVTAHVVGLGQSEFERVKVNPVLLEERYNKPYKSLDGYRESFLYCFQNPIGIKLEQEFE